ncbi:MAG: NADH-quinone oxidoreductase subunit C [Armatimonadetes bacterium]|nr:NADH-quinone oxidoreductase subunit C [Armatimonadota bacterium]
MSADIVARVTGRFPQVRDLVEEARKAREEEERHLHEAVEKAKAEGKRPPGRHESHVPVYRNVTLGVPREVLPDVCRFVRDDPDLQFDFCSFVSAVDLPPDRMEVVYGLFSTSRHHDVVLKVEVARADARVPSVVGIWDGANWHEREAFDLLGVVFEGHPDPRRIMMTDDWAGHPLRKDYVYQEPAWLVDLAVQRQKEIAASGGEPIGERS